jgi:hypothetical protein
MTREGVVIMGCPVGTDDYILNELTSIRKEFDEECSALENLVCPVDPTLKVDKKVINDGHGEDKRHKPKITPGFVHADVKLTKNDKSVYFVHQSCYCK